MKNKRKTKGLASFEQALVLAIENSSPHLSYFRKQVADAKQALKKS
mgnify:CR=1 FL=1